MTGIHRLHHVERFSATYLSNHNTIRSHSERVAYEIPCRHRALAFDIRWTSLESDNVLLLLF